MISTVPPASWKLASGTISSRFPSLDTPQRRNNIKAATRWLPTTGANVSGMDLDPGLARVSQCPSGKPIVSCYPIPLETTPVHEYMHWASSIIIKKEGFQEDSTIKQSYWGISPPLPKKFDHFWSVIRTVKTISGLICLTTGICIPTIKLWVFIANLF